MVAKILKEKFLPKLFLRRTKDLIKDQVRQIAFNRDSVTHTDITP